MLIISKNGYLVHIDCFFDISFEKLLKMQVMSIIKSTPLASGGIVSTPIHIDSFVCKKEFVI